MIRLLLVFWYIISCLRVRTFPWNFFQLNAPYFNAAKGIFSKLDIDRCIPKQWRLAQVPLTAEFTPDKLPIFLKPEWGQNSHGIIRIDSLEGLRKTRKKVARSKVNYIAQTAATGYREFEIFYIRSPKDEQKYAILSITEVTNSCVDRYPINGIHNKCTSYKDCTGTFTENDIDLLWDFFKEICAYKIARVSLRADSIADILTGDFNIIEINIFLPMPLILLDKDLPWAQKTAFIKESMLFVARLTKNLPRSARRQSIFFKKLRAHYKLPKSNKKVTV